MRPRNATTHRSAVNLTRHNAGEIDSLAADKGQDWIQAREKGKEEGMRMLINHSEFLFINCAHNALTDGSLYGQQRLSEAVLSTIKSHVRARTTWPSVLTRIA